MSRRKTALALLGTAVLLLLAGRARAQVTAPCRAVLADLSDVHRDEGALAAFERACEQPGNATRLQAIASALDLGEDVVAALAALWKPEAQPDPPWGFDVLESPASKGFSAFVNAFHWLPPHPWRCTPLIPDLGKALDSRSKTAFQQFWSGATECMKDQLEIAKRGEPERLEALGFFDDNEDQPFVTVLADSSPVVLQRTGNGATVGVGSALPISRRTFVVPVDPERDFSIIKMDGHHLRSVKVRAGSEQPVNLLDQATACLRVEFSANPDSRVDVFVDSQLVAPASLARYRLSPQAHRLSIYETTPDQQMRLVLVKSIKPDVQGESCLVERVDLRKSHQADVGVAPIRLNGCDGFGSPEVLRRTLLARLGQNAAERERERRHSAEEGGSVAGGAVKRSSPAVFREASAGSEVDDWLAGKTDDVERSDVRARYLDREGYSRVLRFDVSCVRDGSQAQLRVAAGELDRSGARTSTFQSTESLERVLMHAALRQLSIGHVESWRIPEFVEPGRARSSTISIRYVGPPEQFDLRIAENCAVANVERNSLYAFRPENAVAAELLEASEARYEPRNPWKHSSSEAPRPSDGMVEHDAVMSLRYTPTRPLGIYGLVDGRWTELGCVQSKIERPFELGFGVLPIFITPGSTRLLPDEKVIFLRAIVRGRFLPFGTGSFHAQVAPQFEVWTQQQDAVSLEPALGAELSLPPLPMYFAARAGADLRLRFDGAANFNWMFEAAAGYRTDRAAFEISSSIMTEIGVGIGLNATFGL